MFYRPCFICEISQILAHSFTFIPAMFTVDILCSYWNSIYLAAWSTFHSLSGQLFQTSGLHLTFFESHFTIIPLPLAIFLSLPDKSGAFPLYNAHPLGVQRTSYSISFPHLVPVRKVAFILLNNYILTARFNKFYRIR